VFVFGLLVGAGIAHGWAAGINAADIGLAVGVVVNLKKMAKHFAIEIHDGYFAWRRRDDQIAAEARSTASMSSAPACRLPRWMPRKRFKPTRISRGSERAFRSLKTVDLERHTSGRCGSCGL